MSIKNWPTQERPREKLLTVGAPHLSDAELLAILIHTGVPGITAVDLARELLIQFGDLRQLLTASQQDFCRLPGLGKAKFALLQAVLEMGKRHQWQQLKRDITLTDPKTTQSFLSAQLRDYRHEVFACVFLDNRHRVLCFEELFQGTIDAASIYPRQLLQQSLKHNAAAVILAHNHPSGVAQPSAADQHITEKLVKALELVDIRVLDHVIVGDGRCFSFAEKGLI